jgi:hypothetical protein
VTTPEPTPSAVAPRLTSAIRAGNGSTLAEVTITGTREAVDGLCELLDRAGLRLVGRVDTWKFGR